MYVCMYVLCVLLLKDPWVWDATIATWPKGIFRVFCSVFESKLEVLLHKR